MYSRLKAALNKTLSKNKVLAEAVKKHNVPLEQIDVTCLPDDFKFEGVRNVNGTFCKTVKQYKAALKKNNKDMGGWSG